MRSLLTLPVELHRIILSFVEPGDIPSLYSSCKHFEALAEDRFVEHRRFTKLHLNRRYKGRYSNLRADETSDPLDPKWENWPVLRRLILDVEEHPRFGWYIQELLWDHPQNQRHLREIATDSDLLKKFIHSSRFISDAEQEDWIQAAEDSKTGVLLALFIVQLPRLKHLSIQNLSDDSTTTYVARIVSKMAERSHHGYLYQPLSTLETVRVNHQPKSWRLKEEEHSDHIRKVLRLIIALTTLPNLKGLFIFDYFSLSFIDKETGNSLDWMQELGKLDSYCPLFHGPSQLKCLEIIPGCISASVLSAILSNCAALEHFKYRIEDKGKVFGWKITQKAPSPDFLVSAICETLLAHARLSLKSLHLEVQGWDPISSPIPTWSFHQFTTLERLTIDLHLFGEEPDSWPLFANILPVSLKEICIFKGGFSEGADNPMIQTMLQSFRPQSFVHLHAFTVWRNTQNTDNPTSDGQIIPMYRSTLSNANIPQSEVHEYHVDYNVFLDRRRARTYPRSPYYDGRFDWGIHELPVADTAGHLIMGIYHSGIKGITATARWDNFFDGVRVKRTWVD